MEKSEKLWSRNFVLIIVINFLVFMNHIMLLSTFPFYIEGLGGGIAGWLITAAGYENMFLVLSAAYFSISVSAARRFRSYRQYGSEQC